MLQMDSWYGVCYHIQDFCHRLHALKSMEWLGQLLVESKHLNQGMRNLDDTKRVESEHTS